MKTFAISLLFCWAWGFSCNPVALAFIVPSQSHSTARPVVSSIPIVSTTQNILPQGKQQKQDTATSLNLFGGIELANLIYDSTATAKDAFDWAANMGAPSALVAGAVLVTVSELRAKGIRLKKKDSKTIRFLKQSMRFLLLTAFALEVVAIFVSTMTGSILLGHGEQTIAKKIIGYGSPLQLLHHHHEFEYLTTQICFLQGLINWLMASAVELFIPEEGEARSSIVMNKCLAAWLGSLIVWILAFYNHRLSFYSDYWSMLCRWGSLFLKQYVFERPIRPLSLIYIPSFFYSLRLTWKAFNSPPDDESEENEPEGTPISP